jgi:hypothetical protein
MTSVAIYIWTYSKGLNINVNFYNEGEHKARSRFKNPSRYSLYRLGQAVKGMKQSVNIDRTAINIHYN